MVYAIHTHDLAKPLKPVTKLRHFKNIL